MTKKEKIKTNFINSPRTVFYQDIKSLLISDGFIFSWWKWSHVKIKNPKTWMTYIMPIHDGECKWIYKDGIKDFYLS